MYILKKTVPACLSVVALAGITKPTILASALKFATNIPTYIKACEDIKSNISSTPQKEDGADTKVLTKQETSEEQKNG